MLNRCARVTAAATLLVTMSCGGSDADNTTPSVSGTSPATAPPTTPQGATTTTEEAATPPSTNEQGDVVHPELPGATLRVSPTELRIGDALSIEIECPMTDDGQASFHFEHGTDSPVYFGIEPTELGSTLYRGTIPIPYWLEPGPQRVYGLCVEGVARPEPAMIDVQHSADGTSTLWRPTQSPWVEDDRAAGSPAPAPADERHADVTFGEPFPLHALCDPDIPQFGARFIVSAKAEREPPVYYTAEFPVPADGYDPIEGGVVISALVTLSADDFPADNLRTRRLRVHAHCVDTVTPFSAKAEPESRRLLLSTNT